MLQYSEFCILFQLVDHPAAALKKVPEWVIELQIAIMDKK